MGIDPWDKAELNDNEKFLRDYILKKKYVDESDDERIPAYNERIPAYNETVKFDEGEKQLENRKHFKESTT